MPAPVLPGTGEEHDYASTQVNLSAGASMVVRDVAKQIPDADLGEEGRETKPHITVKYGLHSDEAIETVRQLLANEPPIRATLGTTSIFPASETGGDDVVKVDVVSEDLRRINTKIAAAVEVTDTHPEYQPHVTLAYVKPGKGQQYAGQTKLQGKKLQFKQLVFSTRAGEHIAIPLQGKRLQPGVAKVAPPNVAKVAAVSGKEKIPRGKEKIPAKVAKVAPKAAAVTEVPMAPSEPRKKRKPKRPPTVKLADVTEAERAQLRQLLERDEMPPKTYGQTRPQYRKAITAFLIELHLQRRRPGVSSSSSAIRSALD